MKKSHKNTELSDQVCEYPGCKIRIKKRLVLKKRKFKFCYKHWFLKEWFRRNNR